MQMGAIAQHYGFENAIQKAIEAGVDIITLGNNLKYDEHIASMACGIIKKLVADGKIPEERINRSFVRIMTLKNTIQ